MTSLRRALRYWPWLPVALGVLALAVQVWGSFGPQWCAWDPLIYGTMLYLLILLTLIYWRVSRPGE